MKNFCLILMSLICIKESYSQQLKPDTTLIEFPFVNNSYEWPFDSIEIKVDRQIYHLFSDTAKQTILCIQTDYNGCLFTVGTYRLVVDNNIHSFSVTSPDPPYKTSTIYIELFKTYRDGVWVFFSNGVILTKEKYRNGILVNE